MIYRTATADDGDALLPLFLEMERFYDGENAISEEDAKPRLLRALRHSPSHAIILAESDEPLGFVSIYEMFPAARLERVWFLKELFVRNAARGAGVGEGLVREAARHALRQGGARLDFTTDRSNEAAQRFYARLRAPIASKIYYSFEDGALESLAGSKQS
ncbi:GNAT family N-acetyltransferase [Aureimonas altamirensis]|uniref:GNAT family N-acetyltransferase n=1 Tax=Aureimonas altamirensis TaxID=370622 RepID=UPI001E4D761C|nr:GNAT family N-acetyltransferase [Aureimonas altamirensis]UHD45763.1 GNAT family N-acetyltransferase [Aureimonas altamirensis]